MENCSHPQWQSIRPWTPRLSLSVREITSVSATFVLSSFTTYSADLEPSLASLGLTSDADGASDSEGSDSGEGRILGVVSEALAKGLSVNLNGSAWPKVYIRIDENLDDAVIIIYGLMPGRHYDIDLGIVQGNQNNSIRKQVVTEESTDPNINFSDDLGDIPNEDLAPAPPQSNTALSHGPLSAPPPLSSSNSASSSQTLEDRLGQLQLSLVALNTERDALTTSLKTVRRDAQKADAALRAEIDILKRASEKNAIAEHRSRQKMLALQEAIKRSQSTSKDIEDAIADIEGQLPDLQKEKEEKEAIYARLKQDAERIKKENEKEAEKERRKAEGVKIELASLGSKLEKLNGKREKVEGSVIPDLEDQLRELKREMASIEAESRDVELSILHDPILADSPEHHVDANVESLNYSLRSSQSPESIGRPSLIQRPSNVNQLPLAWPQLSSHQSSSRTTAKAHRHKSSSSDPNMHSATTSLSSRAPPFEPGRSLAQALKASGSATGTSSGVSILTRQRQASAEGKVKASQ